jgi:DNA-binding NarL/FixJ family response regulator
MTKPPRILIVDDEPLNVDYLEQELDSHGFVTESAANGIEALARIGAAAPDLVLLDVMMPEMDGITALRLLKSDPETRLIPVVLMTALNAIEDRVRGIEAGADDFLSKPVDERELLARIRTALAQKRAIDETVGELRAASAHLERYGRQARDVAVLAVGWRLKDVDLPEGALGFVGRRLRDEAIERIRAHGGLPTETGENPVVAVFDGPDLSSRSVAAVEAALAVLAGGSTARTSPPVVVSAAVSVGRADVGSTRERQVGEPQWVYGAEGEPVERASRLTREAADGGLLLSESAAAAVSERFRLEPATGGAYRLVAPATDDGDEMAPARGIRSILVTDVVGSTQTLERVGDRAWAELLDAHNRATRAELVLFGGEEIDTAGDGFMIAFHSPARAMRCAFALRGRLAELGLTIRCGIHTGEVEPVEGGVRGIAMNIASRIASHAEPGEILVSATTRELAAGADLGFSDRGEHLLKGVSEPRRLYAVAEHVAVAGPDVSAARHVAPAGLTEREVDVLRLVAVGLSDAEVAQQLFLSVRTVNAHLRSIYRKLGVRSRAAAGRYAQERGLL